MSKQTSFKIDKIRIIGGNLSYKACKMIVLPLDLLDFVSQDDSSSFILVSLIHAFFEPVCFDLKLAKL